ncbi:hypothetical protein C4544_06255 [candidate division WS5 bacterium]|uniref:DUF11 domain-containing protein n=1 Tax=candidate division WS5 bacterium TaxID=2093353 RepID=A0A419DA12_9BACT|nr:MAG: hypothetical protein C4544_06255 [candidate division WS5 bacterium]
MGKITLKKKIAAVASFAMLAIAVIVPIAANPKSTDARWNCTPQNVVYCGANDRTDLINQINNGDGAHSDLKSLYAGMGIFTEDLAGTYIESGVVTRDGRVLLANGQQVASNVVMGWRPTPGLTGTSWHGLTWNYLPNAFGPNTPQDGALVYMYKGQFQYAIDVVCGNPILKNLSPVPPRITVDKVVRNVTQGTDPKAFFENVSAKPGDIVRFKIKVFNNSTVTAQQTTISDALPNYLTIEPGTGELFHYELENNAWKMTSQKISDSDIKSGRVAGNLRPNQDAFLLFNAVVNENVPAGCNNLVNTGFADSSQTNPVSDTASVTVCKEGPPPPPPPGPPVTPPVTPPAPGQPTALPVSGPVEAAAGVMGTGALGYAGYMWRRSRKNLLDVLKNK